MSAQGACRRLPPRNPTHRVSARAGTRPAAAREPRRAARTLSHAHQALQHAVPQRDLERRHQHGRESPAEPRNWFCFLKRQAPPCLNRVSIATAASMSAHYASGDRWCCAVGEDRGGVPRRPVSLRALSGDFAGLQRARMLSSALRLAGSRRVASAALQTQWARAGWRQSAPWQPAAARTFFFSRGNGDDDDGGDDDRKKDGKAEKRDKKDAKKASDDDMAAEEGKSGSDGEATSSRRRSRRRSRSSDHSVVPIGTGATRGPRAFRGPAKRADAPPARRRRRRAAEPARVRRPGLAAAHVPLHAHSAHPV